MADVGYTYTIFGEDANMVEAFDNLEDACGMLDRLAVEDYGYAIITFDPLGNPVGRAILSSPKVRKARWGWWVDGRWCPTSKIREHEIERLRACERP